MLFNKYKAISVALAVANLLPSSQAFLADFEAYFDFTLGLALPTKDECEPKKSLIQIGVNVDIDVDLSKREMEYDSFPAIEELGLDKRIFSSSNVPKAAFSVSDIALVSGSKYKVTINFETAASDSLDKTFTGETTDVKLTGLGDPDSETIFGPGSHAGIGNPFQWSATVLVDAEPHGQYYCLPHDFEIHFDIDANADQSKLDLWKKYFQSNFKYTLDPNLADARKVQAIKRAIELHERKLIDITANADVLLKIGTDNSVLPNYCWKPSCNPSSSSAPPSSSSTTTPTTSSATPTTTSSSTTSSSSTPVSTTTTTASPSPSPSPSTTSSSSSAVPSSSSSSSAASSSSSSVASSSSAASSSASSASPSSTSLAPVASTKTVESTTVITITSCSDNKCSKVPVTTGLTTVTDESTIYTTYCPLSTVTDISTTVVTITSCANDKCHEVPVTTGLTTVTENDTIYTTYCPLTGEKTTTAAVAPTSSPVAVAPTSTSTKPAAEAPKSSAPGTVAPGTAASKPATEAPNSTVTSTATKAATEAPKSAVAPQSAATKSGSLAPASVVAATSQAPKSTLSVVQQSTSSAAPVPTVQAAEGSASGLTVSYGFVLGGLIALLNI